MTLIIPPLPSAWPYTPRPPRVDWERREDIDLGSLGSGWNLMVPPDRVIPESEERLSGAFGRGGIQRRGDLVLRPYRRGGLVRFLLRSGYASPRRFEREWLVHRALWDSGFPTVRPSGYGYRRNGLAFEGVYLSDFQEGMPWPSDWSAGKPHLSSLVQAIRALCDWGLWAPDLNATNVLLMSAGPVLLDWDRSAFVRGSDLRPLYQRRMLRSLARLDAPAAISQAFTDGMQTAGSHR